MKDQKGRLEMGVSPIRSLGKMSGTDMLGAGGFEDGLTDALEGRSGSRELGRDEKGHSHPEGHGSNDHLASIYEGQRDQFAAVVPFIKQGLEQGERCLYVADDNTEDEVLEALQEGGIDISEALESGALSIHTKSETYLRGGEFETGSMLEFWQEALAKAIGGEGYAGLRAAAEMTWALGDDALTGEGFDQLAEYEALLNNLYSGEDYVVLCQYSRERFPEEILSEVIRSHPFVVYNGTVCDNIHYHPPEEFFEAERPPLDVSRTVEGLLRRAQTRQTLQKRGRFQRTLYKITSDPGRSFEEKLEALFDLGCEYFGLELGGIARIDPEADLFEIERTSGPHEHLVPGAQVALSETYCRLIAEGETVVGISDPAENGLEEMKAYKEFGARAYLGTRLELDGGLEDRTFFFVSNEPKEEPFTEAERTFHHLMAQWVEQELRRKKREEDLKELNETLEERVEKRTRQVRELTAKVTLAEQRERDRIARLLHDGLQQRLYGSQLKISSLRREALGTGQEGLAGQLQKVEGEIEEITHALRQLSVGMSPPVLEGDGLKGALEWLRSHMKEVCGLEVELEAEREFRVKEEMRVLLFRATKELLATIAECPEISKCSQSEPSDTSECLEASDCSDTSGCSKASQATVELREEKKNLVIEVVGEGEGFDLETLEGPEEGFSLKGACERLRLFGGELKLNAGPAEARAEIRVPMDRRVPEGDSTKRMPLEGEGEASTELTWARAGENGEAREDGEAQNGRTEGGRSVNGR